MSQSSESIVRFPHYLWAPSTRWVASTTNGRDCSEEEEEEEGFSLWRRQGQLMNDKMKACSQHAAGNAVWGRFWRENGLGGRQPPFKHSECCSARHYGRTQWRGACLCIHWRLKWFSLTWQHDSTHTPSWGEAWWELHVWVYPEFRPKLTLEQLKASDSFHQPPVWFQFIRHEALWKIKLHSWNNLFLWLQFVTWDDSDSEVWTKQKLNDSHFTKQTLNWWRLDSSRKKMVDELYTELFCSHRPLIHSLIHSFIHSPMVHHQSVGGTGR